ncbi:hypothetical protein AB4452_04645 [Vibrio lentus]
MNKLRIYVQGWHMEQLMKQAEESNLSVTQMILKYIEENTEDEE